MDSPWPSVLRGRRDRPAEGGSRAEMFGLATACRCVGGGCPTRDRVPLRRRGCPDSRPRAVASAGGVGYATACRRGFGCDRLVAGKRSLPGRSDAGASRRSAPVLPRHVPHRGHDPHVARAPGRGFRSARAGWPPRRSARGRVTMSHAVISIPGVQNPHCSAWCRANASRSASADRVVSQPFDGHHVRALAGLRVGDAGADRLPVDEHRAGAAHPVLAAEMGAGQVEGGPGAAPRAACVPRPPRCHGSPLTIRRTVVIRNSFSCPREARCPAGPGAHEPDPGSRDRGGARGAHRVPVRPSPCGQRPVDRPGPTATAAMCSFTRSRSPVQAAISARRASRSAGAAGGGEGTASPPGSTTGFAPTAPATTRQKRRPGSTSAAPIASASSPRLAAKLVEAEPRLFRSARNHDADDDLVRSQRGGVRRADEVAYSNVAFALDAEDLNARVRAQQEAAPVRGRIGMDDAAADGAAVAHRAVRDAGCNLLNRVLDRVRGRSILDPPRAWPRPPATTLSRVDSTPRSASTEEMSTSSRGTAQAKVQHRPPATALRR